MWAGCDWPLFFLFFLSKFFCWGSSGGWVVLPAFEGLWLRKCFLGCFGKLRG